MFAACQELKGLTLLEASELVKARARMDGSRHFEGIGFGAHLRGFLCLWRKLGSAVPSPFRSLLKAGSLRPLRKPSEWTPPHPRVQW